MRTRITEEYGIEAPIIGAGMGFVATAPLAAAVSNAGALGVLGAGPEPPDRVRAMIRETRQLTTRPFGVNFITRFASDAHIDVAIKEKVPLVVFLWDEPPAQSIARLHAGGAKVWMQVGSVAEGRAAIEDGVDAVVAQGMEAGGHNRSVAATLSLVPNMVDAMSPVPVIAAGGIADGRGVAAALALGAEAVWVGTRLVASREAYAHEEYKRRLLRAGVGDTARTTMFTIPVWPNEPIRMLRTPLVAEWVGREREIPPPADPPQIIGRTLFVGQEMPVPRFTAIVPTPDTSGDFEEMSFLAGESAGLTREVKSAGEIVREMISEAEEVIRGRLAGMVR